MFRRPLLALLLLACCSAGALAKANPTKENIASGGAQRTYYLFVPEKPGSPVPLLLLLHGSGRNGMSQIDQWKSLAEKKA